MMDEAIAVFKTTRTAPLPIVEATRGIGAIEDDIIKILIDNEPRDKLPEQPMLEWLEVGGFTCMRVNLVDEATADEDGFSRIYASTLILTDTPTTEQHYPALIAQNLRLSLRFADGRVPPNAVDEW